MIDFAGLQHEILNAIERNDGLAPTTLLDLFSCRHTPDISIQDALSELRRRGFIELDSNRIYRRKQ